MKCACTGVFTAFCMIALLSAQPSKIQPAATADNAAVKTAAVEDRGVEKILGGTIVSVDQAKKSITIRAKSGDYAVFITPNTSVTAKNNTLTPADLNAGDYVSVNYRKFKNGERRADRIDNRTFIARTAAPAPKTQTQNNPAQKTGIKTQPSTQPITVQQKDVKTQSTTPTQPVVQKEAKAQPATQPATQPEPAVQKEAKTQPATQQKPGENKNTGAAK